MPAADAGRARALAAALAGGWMLAGAACNSGPTAAPAASAPTVDPAVLAAQARDAAMIAELRRFEQPRRAAADFAAAPPSDGLFGADPYVVRAVGGDRFVGLLRGAEAVVLLDGEMKEIARAPARGSPSGLAVSGDTAFVVGERSGMVLRYRVERAKLTARPPIPLGPVAARDVAVGANGAVYVAEEERGRLLALLPDAQEPNSYEQAAVPAGAGAFRVLRTQGAVIVGALLEHTVRAYRVDDTGRPFGAPAEIRNDGPLWSFAAVEEGGEIWIASGGVENKALDRTHGSFENIDSFLYVHRLAWNPHGMPLVAQVAAINLSEHGVVTPKALDIERTGGALAMTVTGYGGEAFATVRMRDDGSAPEVQVHPLAPGTSSFARAENGDLVIANPLLDAWIRYRTEHLPGPTAVVDPGPQRSVASRIGEALIFTTLIAPWNRSDGGLSRFTCETCHFEGYVDGRTHATGRGDVRATTKPLLGLWNNRPHFSRALDPDLAAVAHAEFRVAGARSGHDPVFDLQAMDRPWLVLLGASDADLTAPAMRRGFMTFLMEQSHRTSALTVGRSGFSEEERRGALVFRERCESCHEARLASDVAESRLPFEQWESKVFSSAAPIVWARARYEKTGVLPYVHPEGARVPSLRRLYKKWPYFTNGSAKSVAEVLSRVRFGAGVFFHDAGSSNDGVEALSGAEQADLQAFLRLL